jgi:haloacetate dehalogenase
MTQLADLFPGYESRFFETSAGKIFARIGGKGSPVLLLHGYPESNVMWHRLAPLLAGEHSLVIPDLPGYGQSDAPESGPGHAPYDKRSMAKAMVEVMQSLGHDKFAVVGHDRGGRVAYRLALDHPGRVTKISTLDIVPTWEMWTGLNAKRAMKVFHWTFLAQPFPMPEMLIGKAPVEYLEWKMLAWNGKGENSVFDPRALDHYRAAYKQPARLHATCEDYRAGQTTDFANDDADVKAGRKIEAPFLTLWGATGIPAAGESPLDVWKRWAVNVTGKAIPCGHFLPEEAPQETAAELIPFLR